MRIYNSEAGAIDLCRDCWPTEAEAIEKYAKGPDGPDGRGNCFEYDAEHPWFFNGWNDEEDDFFADEEYDCGECGCRLTQRDVNIYR